jgi:hypothetical protein
MTNDHKKYILNLLDMLKPCNCNRNVLHVSNVTLDCGCRHDSFIAGRIDVRQLTEVHFSESGSDRIIDSDNQYLVCENCGTDWTAWNYLLDERFRTALAQLAVEE